jgi:Protein of unknown function (DUF1302)
MKFASFGVGVKLVNINIRIQKMRNTSLKPYNFKHNHIAIAVVACLSSTVTIAQPESPFSGMKVGVSGQISYGNTTRIENPSPELVNSANAAVVGVSGSAPGGRNIDDGNLNYKKGDTVSNVLKGVFNLELKSEDYRAYFNVRAWQDQEMEKSTVPWGSTSNRFAANTPLSDAGYDGISKFSGFELGEAFVERKFTFTNEGNLLLRVGQQNIDWGRRSIMTGGLSGVSPVDSNAQRRPGALPSEINIPFLGISAKYTINKQWSVDSFYQYEWKSSELPVCGTFYSGADYFNGGCDKLILGSGNDRALLAAGSFIGRSDVLDPSNKHNQLGIALQYKSLELGTDFGLYLANYHSRSAMFGVIKTRRTTAAPAVANNPSGLNPSYILEYPENIGILGLDFSKRTGRTVYYGELTYRPNQPVRLNSGDLFNPFLSTATTAAFLRADERATSLGGLYKGYDRLKATQFQLGVSSVFEKFLAGSDLLVSGEFSYKRINNLPDPSIRRYGRSDVFGTGVIGGVCPAGALPKQCSNDGFVSKDSYALRLRASSTFKNILPNTSITPSIAFGKDIKGWSHDGAISEGRNILGLGIRLEYKDVFAGLTINRTWGGDYDVATDRDTRSFFVGFRF